MSESIIIPFLTILIAEFLDKSQLSVLLLASKTKHHLSLLLGVLFAFLVVDGAAILFGSILTSFIPLRWVQVLSGVLFIIFGIRALLEKSDDKQHVGKIKNAFLSGFTLIFLAEWGDKTQLASALFATQYSPLLVMVGVMLALTLLSILAIFLSKVVTSRIERHVISKIAGLIFIVLGISFFFVQ